MVKQTFEVSYDHLKKKLKELYPGGHTLIVIVGDSTVKPEIWHKVLTEKEMAKKLGKGFIILNIAADGFKTEDCLFGAALNGALPPQYKKSYSSENFHPLYIYDKALREADFFIVSVMGNGIREFLYHAFSQPSEEMIKLYIQRKFAPLIAGIQEYYQMLLVHLARVNEDAHQIISTQYYTSLLQHSPYGIYSRIQSIAEAINLGENPKDSRDGIHAAMKKAFSEIFKYLYVESHSKYVSRKHKPIVVDMASSLDPSVQGHHENEIEPGEEAVRKMSDIFSTLIRQIVILEKNIEGIKCFDPEFFTNHDEDQRMVYMLNIDINNDQDAENWSPRHPAPKMEGIVENLSGSPSPIEEKTTKKDKDKGKSKLKFFTIVDISPDEEKVKAEKKEEDFSLQDRYELASNIKLLRTFQFLEKYLPESVTCQNLHAFQKNKLAQNVVAAAYGYLTYDPPFFLLDLAFGKMNERHTVNLVRTIVKNINTITDQSINEFLETWQSYSVYGKEEREAYVTELQSGLNLKKNKEDKSLCLIM